MSAPLPKSMKALVQQEAMYFHLGFPFPGAKVEGSPWVFVYGGSTSLGLFAIQFAKLAGHRVIAACSSKNFDLVKEYGADEVVDYHDGAAAGDTVRRITRNSLTIAYDAISNESSIKLTFDCFSTESAEKKLVAVQSYDDAAKELTAAKGVVVSQCNALSLCGMTDGIDPNANSDFYAKLCEEMPAFIEIYGVRAAPVKLLQGGLDGINAGFDLFRDGKVSGEKLIIKI